MRLELLTLQEELNREKIIANEQIFELANEIKSSKSHYEGIIAKIEKDYSSKISQNFKQNMDKAQSTEETLMEELKRQDDDLENLRRNNKELEKKVEFVRKQKENLENDYQKRIDLLEKKDLKVEPSKIEAKLKKSYELAKEKLESEITQNNDIIEKLNEIKANNMKKILHLEGENKKYLEINIRFQEKFENMEKTQNENEQNFANIIKGYEEKFKELESKYEFEKQTNSYFRNMSRPTIFKPNLPNSPKNQEKNLLNESLSTELKGIENLSTVNFNLTSEEENTNKSPDSSSNYKKNKSVFKFIPQNTIDEYSSESESSENEVKSSEKLPKIDENIEIEKKEISQSNDNDFQNKSPQEKIKIGIANQDDRETLTEEITKFEEGQMILKLIGNKDEEIEDLKRENQLLKNDLANTEKKWLKELDDKRNKELNQLKSDQNLRRQSIDVLLQNKQMKNFSETDFKKVLKEKKELEAENYRLKKESDGNIEFLKEELKKMEEKISENDVKLIQALNERDYFEQQWKELLEEMKLGKMNLEKDKKVTNEKKVSKWLFCGCK